MWMMGLLVLALALPQTAAAAVDVLKDPEGKTIALVLDCNSCKGNPKGDGCSAGMEEGFHDGVPCGQCLMKSNHPTRIPYAHDLMILGTLKDEHGQPLGGQFVKLFLPNTWTVRTRTANDGLFRLVLGATVERKGKPIVLELGTRTMRKDSKADHYALFMVPENYKPCETAEKK
jgi:hypothetical protein